MAKKVTNQMVVDRWMYMYSGSPELGDIIRVYRMLRSEAGTTPRSNVADISDRRVSTIRSLIYRALARKYEDHGRAIEDDKRREENAKKYARWDALYRATQKAGIHDHDTGIHVYVDLGVGWKEGDKIRVEGVNWAAKGTRSLEETLEFAAKLTRAAEYAKTIPTDPDELLAWAETEENWNITL